MLSQEYKKELIDQTLGYLLEDNLLEEMLHVAKVRETHAHEIIVHVHKGF
jgi:hypothetical protein